jgi:hypothetical protein
MSNIRNSQLLQRVGRHPLRATLAKALDLAEAFAGDVEYLSLDKNLSEQGRQNAMQSKLRAAIRDLRDAKAPIVEMQKKLDAKRKAVAMPPIDPSDVVGFLRRQELRTALRATTDRAQRAFLLQDPAFADAMLEQPPVLSGLLPTEQFLVDATKKERLGSLFAPQLAEIDSLESEIAEARAITDVARNDLQSSSGLDRRVFEELVKPVEAKQGAPWLKRDKDSAGNEIIRVVDLEAHVARVATPDQVRDGKFYADHAEYLADRAA